MIEELGGFAPDPTAASGTMRTEVRRSIKGVGSQSDAREFVESDRPTMSGNTPHSQWLILRQKELGIDYHNVIA
jgi:hypothetical protein